jgi:hypothetical protein
LHAGNREKASHGGGGESGIERDARPVHLRELLDQRADNEGKDDESDRPRDPAREPPRVRRMLPGNFVIERHDAIAAA